MFVCKCLSAGQLKFKFHYIDIQYLTLEDSQESRFHFEINTMQKRIVISRWTVIEPRLFCHGKFGKKHKNYPIAFVRVPLL